ncbi:hypothetical protein HPB51_002137 [Rhipicephalus microplus]|uniref:Uncharacterized protein n=1 Tax=Rhipicephalus microplus TaxID=6941 RepID=A0A9J6EQY9_RHIMP|nr:hypothetical protein HPB51_002137 [Rhipicephalus microplus]
MGSFGHLLGAKQLGASACRRLTSSQCVVAKVHHKTAAAGMLSRRSCQDRQCSDGVDAETTRYVGPSPWRFGSVIFLGFFVKLSGILFILVGFNSAIRVSDSWVRPHPSGHSGLQRRRPLGRHGELALPGCLMAIHALDPLAASGVF